MKNVYFSNIPTLKGFVNLLFFPWFHLTKFKKFFLSVAPIVFQIRKGINYSKIKLLFTIES